MKHAYLLGIILVWLNNSSVKAQLAITWPVDHAVFQRNGSDNATFTLAGQYVGCASTYHHLETQVERLDKYGTYQYVQQSWNTIGRDQYSNTPMGFFAANITLPKGWFRLVVKAVNNLGGTVSQNDIKVGVGDVYIISGQSNAQSIVDPNLALPSDTPYDCVVANLYHNECEYVYPSGSTPGYIPYPRFPAFQPLQINQPIAPAGYNNWCYTYLGNRLVETYETPVSFFNTASGGTHVGAWWDSANGIPVTGMRGIGNPCGGSPLNLPSNTGLPYALLKNSLNYFASMFGVKAILWHQGESDTDKGTSQSDYYNKLTGVIDKTRTDFNNSSLWWVIASPATWYGGVTSSNVAAGQNQATTYTNSSQGPDTDKFNNSVRLTDQTHLTGAGLTGLGNEWKNHLPVGNPIAANDIAQINVQDYGNGTYTLIAPPGYTEYRWVNSNGNMGYGSIGTSSSITGYSNVNYRCYMKNSSNNWVLSPLIEMYSCSNDGSGGVSGRMGIEEEFKLFSFKTFPNPGQDKINAEFTLERDSQVRLQILDVTGRIVKSVVEGRHAAQQFTYPIQIQDLKPGEYMVQLKVDEMAVLKKIIKQ